MHRNTGSDDHNEHYKRTRKRIIFNTINTDYFEESYDNDERRRPAKKPKNSSRFYDTPEHAWNRPRTRSMDANSLASSSSATNYKCIESSDGTDDSCENSSGHEENHHIRTRYNGNPPRRIYKDLLNATPNPGATKSNNASNNATYSPPPRRIYQASQPHEPLPSLAKIPQNFTQFGSNVDGRGRSDAQDAALLNNQESERQIGAIEIDSSISFESLGGLQCNQSVIKERIILPMLYPDVYSNFNINASKGILFYGPPGTGKTMMAKAMASECQRFAKQVGKKVTFFARKGADLYSKWVGETEKNLKDLFETAQKARPAIIFFDEIDGLAPSRNSSHDHVHNSTVATFLALLDGMDSRGDVVVIGATNRLDSIDIALRRPGRFDREVFFDLPNEKARKEILSIYIDQWKHIEIAEEMVDFLSKKTANYCGADLKELCNQACINAIKRVYPQLYRSTKRLKINRNKIFPIVDDFLTALQIIRPNSQRDLSATNQNCLILASSLSSSHASTTQTLISTQIDSFESFLDKTMLFSQSLIANMNSNRNHTRATSGEDIDYSELVTLSDCLNPFYKSAVAVCGQSNDGFEQIFLPLVLSMLKEHASTVKILDISDLYYEESPVKLMTRCFIEAKQTPYSILLVKDLSQLFKSEEREDRVLLHEFMRCIRFTRPNEKLLLLFVESRTFDTCRFDSQFATTLNIQYFNYECATSAQKRQFLHHSLTQKLLQILPNIIPHRAPRNPHSHSSHDVQDLSEDEQATQIIAESNRDCVIENYSRMIRSLRIVLRTIVKSLLKDKRFNIFLKPVDCNECEDYYQIIKNPMCISDMIKKIDYDRYRSIAEFVGDIDLILKNAVEYNPEFGEDLLIRHRAFDLKDHCMQAIESIVEANFEENLKNAIESYTLLSKNPRVEDSVNDCGSELKLNRDQESVANSNIVDSCKSIDEKNENCLSFYTKQELDVVFDLRIEPKLDQMSIDECIAFDSRLSQIILRLAKTYCSENEPREIDDEQLVLEVRHVLEGFFDTL